MAQERLRVVLEFEGKDAEKRLKAFNDNLEETEKQGKKSSSAMDSFNLALIGINQALEIAAKGARAVKQAIDFAREGAELEYTRQQFDRLAKEIGTTGDILRNNLSVATKGLLSDMEATTLATDFLRLGLVDTEEDVLRLAAASAELGFDMNELTLALANQSKRRLDQLGISVTLFNEKLAELKAQGLDTNEAFTEAFLRSAEDQIERVGERSEDTVGHWAQLDAHLADARAELKLLSNEITKSPLATLLAWMEDVEQREIGLDFLAEDISFFTREFGDFVPTAELTGKQIQGLGAQIQQTGRQFGISTEQVRGYARASGLDLLDAFNNLNPEIAEFIKRQQEANEITQRIQKEFDGTTDEIEEQAESLDNTALAWEQYSDAQMRSSSETLIWKSVTADDGDISDTEREALIKLRDEQGLFNEDLEQSIDNFRILGEDGVSNLDEVAKALDAGEEEPWVWELLIDVRTQRAEDEGVPVDILDGLSQEAQNQLMEQETIVRAKGGPLTGFNLVGEEGPELIIGNMVIPADITRDLLNLGIQPTHKFAGGGTSPEIHSMDNPEWFISSGGTSKSGTSTQRVVRQSQSSGGGGTTVVTTEPVVTTQAGPSEVAIAEETSEVISQQVQQAVQSQTREIRNTVAKQERTQRETNTILVDIREILFGQPSVDDMRDIELEAQDTSGF